MITWKQWLIYANLFLGINVNTKDALLLLMTVIKQKYTNILAFDETLLTLMQYKMLNKLLLRRKLGEPIAYITGKCEFWSLPIQVSKITIIPRHDTECLVQCALDLELPKYINVLDLGTGTGIIALALALEQPTWKIVGIDRSMNIINLANSNANYLNLSKNINFLQSNWFSLLKKQKFNLIVSNPPYIKQNDYHLFLGDVRYEPLSALIGGDDGLKYLTKIIIQSRYYLFYKGWLLLEHGYQQGKMVRFLFKKFGFKNISTIHDYNNHERVTKGQWLIL